MVAIGFFTGAFLLAFFSYLPSLVMLLFFLSVACVLYFFSYQQRLFLSSSYNNGLQQLLIFIISALVSFSYVLMSATSVIEARLKSEFVAKDIIVEGVIANIPQHQQDRWRFYLDVSMAKVIDKNNTTLQEINLKGKLKLSWYHRKKSIQPVLFAGQTWRVRVRLKQPNSFMNYGGFDYEKWLFSNRVNATGYVRQSTQNRLLEASPWYSLHYQRQKLSNKIKQLLNDEPTSDNMASAIIMALAVASRDDISEQQWALFRQTGTSHLIAISGLHIGIVAGLGYFLIAVIWWLLPFLYQKIPVRIAGAFLAISLATVYALLAGFTLPTQRSLIMVIGIVIALIQRQQLKTFNIVSIALILILLLDPFALMSASFWLSFGAVILILFYVNRQQRMPRFSFFRLQLMLSLGMFPLTIFFFGSAALISPIANLIAIPWVALIIVPLILLAMVLLYIVPFLSAYLFQFVSFNIDYLLHLLAWLDALPFTVIEFHSLSTPLILVMMLGLSFLFLPKGFPAKWLGVLLLIPLFLEPLPTIQQQGAFKYTLLDVGQGLASVIETKHHVLIYDVGAKIGKGFDMGELVVLPFLQAKGIQKIDKMVISHKDIDHRGGATALLKAIKVDEVISSNTQFLTKVKINRCLAGQKWQWDEVTFEFIHPESDAYFSGMKISTNNQSCVLRVSNQYHSLLLTGDIEKKVEVSLLKMKSKQLKTEVLLMPHHGSATSSTQAFIDAVKPTLVLNSSGYYNKFKHPAEKVVQRYQHSKIPIYDTVTKGEITLLFPADNKPLILSSYREKNLRFWHRVTDWTIKEKHHIDHDRY
jgi:competence protein ComEC